MQAITMSKNNKQFTTLIIKNINKNINWSGRKTSTPVQYPVDPLQERWTAEIWLGIDYTSLWKCTAGSVHHTYCRAFYNLRLFRGLVFLFSIVPCMASQICFITLRSGNLVETELSALLTLWQQDFCTEMYCPVGTIAVHQPECRVGTSVYNYD